MTFWIVAAVATALAVALMVRPLMRGSARDGVDGAGDPDHDPSTAAALKVYRAQLAEVDRDRARGLLDDQQAEASRIEISRRMLALARGRQTVTAEGPVTPWARRVAMVLTIAVPIAVLGLYVPTGSPDLPSQPLAGRDVGDREARIAMLEEARTLEAALEDAPDDLIGWLKLGVLHTDLEDYDRAVDAFARAVDLSSGDPHITSLYAEAIVNADDGIVTREARLAFEQALESAPNDPRARFYLAMGREQAGDLEGALDRWVDLAAGTPADAPWLAMVRSQITRTAQRIGANIDTVMPDPQPAAGQNTETLTRDPATAVRVIDALEDATAETPGDLSLWFRLGDLRAELGDLEGAAEAFNAADRNAPDGLPDDQRLQLLETRASALMAMHDGDMANFMTPEFVDVLGRILELDPDNDRALWFLGVAAEQDGDMATATRHWNRLLETIPPDSPAAALLRERLGRE
ncbi:c-type cytochrome biogenesis protein CcmI [Fodinicurvata sp. EGI_FJ10296]|uniref:c-type cytochrome biogenesis protein CcmI n=1 Tax=Fodinicurvata sp. EGI_FJ10296 TaxID=3231908 RepID=UPI003454564A